MWLPDAITKPALASYYLPVNIADRSQWAKATQHEYPIYAQLAADQSMVNACNLAIKYIPHPPVIYRIPVDARDEILGAGMRVLVHDEQGRLLEAAYARQTQKDLWEYISKVESRIFQLTDRVNQVLSYVGEALKLRKVGKLPRQ